MARIQFVVSNFQGKWYVVTGGKRHGPYSTQKAAIDDAVKAAHNTPNSQVLVQGTDSKFRTEWTYGNDPRRYPG